MGTRSKLFTGLLGLGLVLGPALMPAARGADAPKDPPPGGAGGPGGGPGGQRRPGGGGPTAMLDRLHEAVKALDLTDAQKPKIDAAFADAKTKLEAATKDAAPGGDRAAMREKTKPIMDELNKAIEATLTPEQNEKLAKSRPQGRGGPGGPGGRRPGGPGGPGGDKPGSDKPAGDKPSSDKPSDAPKA